MAVRRCVPFLDFLKDFFLFFDEPVVESVSFENFYCAIIGGAFIIYLARFLLRTAHLRQLNSFKNKNCWQKTFSC